MLTRSFVLASALSAALLAATPAGAASLDIVGLINAYRASPQQCQGERLAPLPALAAPAALGRVRIGTGTFLEQALERAGYPVEHAEAVYLSNVADAGAAMTLLRENFCDKLLSADFAAAGAVRTGDDWVVLFARPLHEVPLPAPTVLDAEVLAAVNAARAVPRRCGEQPFGAAPPLRWNTALTEAALAHSSDMAAHRYFSHEQKNGSVVDDRATRAGYAWSRIGENIAAGQKSVAEAVAGWLDSPGHCANIMNAGFDEMGLAYAVNPERGRVYWTQVLGRRR
ncbi:CAP domain-containing protein [Pseudoduganella chitinolytica]|uniref:CAP domain-containing protein n=1 Tax=Pseudoduganella chitinolytica TaxID=34070 RepID=A0ABY8B6Q6_9BURK|nr:CAP domain-containing protein [Pseudoduganella chitinolytica]WEF30693.1 CAP domain-containing protein [Pseudoduganella chitinolytica]